MKVAVINFNPSLEERPVEIRVGQKIEAGFAQRPSAGVVEVDMGGRRHGAGPPWRLVLADDETDLSVGNSYKHEPIIPKKSKR